MLEHNAVLFLLVWLNVAYRVHKLPVEQARHHAFHTIGHPVNKIDRRY